MYISRFTCKIDLKILKNQNLWLNITFGTISCISRELLIKIFSEFKGQYHHPQSKIVINKINMGLKKGSSGQSHTLIT